MRFGAPPELPSRWHAGSYSCVRVRSGFRVGVVLWIVTAFARVAAADVGVYADGVASGWQDWSWGGVTRSFAQASPVHAGSAAIGVTYTDGWSGLQLGTPSSVDVSVPCQN